MGYHGNSKILLPWGVPIHHIFYSVCLFYADVCACESGGIPGVVFGAVVAALLLVVVALIVVIIILLLKVQRKRYVEPIIIIIIIIVNCSCV